MYILDEEVLLQIKLALFTSANLALAEFSLTNTVSENMHVR